MTADSIDAFSTRLLEQGKRFLEKADESKDSESIEAFSHAALLLCFSALEAHMNSLADELLLRNGLTALDRSILSEREVVLEDGEFVVSERLKIYRFEDRLVYMFRRFSNGQAPKSSSWWVPLKEGIRLRNMLVHPKEHISIEPDSVRQLLVAILGCLNDLFQAIFGRPYPQIKRGANSTLKF